MYLFENPVLQRELLVNLRTRRAFLLLALYQLLLAIVVLVAWPSEQRLDLTGNPQSSKKLVDLFFLGQYVIASLMAPSFAAGAISGEKERMTYEMLLASPLRPGAIVLGKMIASLTHLGMLILASLPIIVLCLPLGGISLYEVIAAYVGLIVSVILFGAIGIAASSYFKRTSASLVVSYLVVLGLVLIGVLFWKSLEYDATLRLKIALMVLPAYGLTAVILLCSNAAARMLYPPDMGSEGQEVVDLETEAERAIGLVIQRDQFPDRLFAPPKKQQLMPDGTNPVYDKEIHSEIFSQGTLMLRLVIQISMLLAIPLMAWLLFAQPWRCGWFAVYVMVFNMLVGPVFLAGSMTSERERQTLDLLLTTTITPAQLLWGKLIVGFRISAVLTSFLMLPLVLAAVLMTNYYSNALSLAAMFLIIFSVCVTNAMVGMTCSVFAHKTSISLMSTYSVLLVLYALPVAVVLLLEILQFDAATIDRAQWFALISPIAAVFDLPLDANVSADPTEPAQVGNITRVGLYFVVTAALNGVLFLAIRWRLGARMRIAE